MNLIELLQFTVYGAVDNAGVLFGALIGARTKNRKHRTRNTVLYGLIGNAVSNLAGGLISLNLTLAIGASLGAIGVACAYLIARYIGGK